MSIAQKSVGQAQEPWNVSAVFCEEALLLQARVLAHVLARVLVCVRRRMHAQHNQRKTLMPGLHPLGTVLSVMCVVESGSSGETTHPHAGTHQTHHAQCSPVTARRVVPENVPTKEKITSISLTAIRPPWKSTLGRQAASQWQFHRI